MGDRPTLKDLVGADLARFKIVLVFGVHPLNELGSRCYYPELFKDRAQAEAYAVRAPELWGQEIEPVLILSDGVYAFMLLRHEAVDVFASADDAIADKKRRLAERQPPP